MPLDIYSHWLQLAFPQPSQRQRYFKDLIAKKPISHANFRLAHLLLEKRLATLVVTPNFDDFLSRALDLFGQPHIICDHPYTVERIDPESPEIQIVHVHGTYWFYDCCNLRGEIEARTKDSRERAETMTSLLDKIMSRHSPIVIGYSGWEGDVIMTALKRRLTSGLPYNLYWFCYERAGLEPLRGFFKNHSDVCLVLPPVAPGPESTATTDKLSDTGEKLLSASASQATLSAQLVLDTFVGNFTTKAPQIFLDPVGFFLDQLRGSFPPDSVERQSDDIYNMTDLIRYVEHVRSTAKALTEIEGAIKNVIDAVRRSAYSEAIDLAQPLASRTLSDEQRETLIDSVYSASVGLMDNSQSELDGYNLVVALAVGDVLKRPRVRWYVAVALFNKAATLGQLNRSEEEIQACDELLRRFGDATEPALRERVAKALVNKGITLGQLSRSEEAVQAYDEVVRRLGDATEPALREQVAKALVNKGVTLGQLSRGDEAVQAYDEVLRRFGDTTEAALREPVARTLVNKGARLGWLDRREEAIQACDEVLRRFGDATEPALREQVARALVNKGITLGELSRSEDEIQAYDDVVRRFGDATEPALREQVAKALVYKGITLGGLSRSEEGIQAYDEVPRRFGDATEPALREGVAKALVYKGITLRQLNRDEEVVRAYDEVLRRFGDATEPALREQVAKALVNKGVTLGQLNRSEEAIQVCDEVVRRFGDATEPALRGQVARALVNKGIALRGLNRPADARTTFQELTDRFANDTDGVIKSLIETAKTEINNLDVSEKQLSEAEGAGQPPQR